MSSLSRILTALSLFLLPAAVHAQNLINPLGATDLRIVIGNVIRVLLGFSGVLALLAFVWGGLQFVLSRGNADMVKQGKQTLIYAALGLVVLFTAYALVSTLVTVLATSSAAS